MDPRLVVSVAAIILVAEIPDKTAISTFVLASKYRATPVFLGASAAFVIQVALGATVGGLLARLNHKIILIVSSLLFLLGGLYLILKKESLEEKEGEKLGQKNIHSKYALLSAFTITFLGEFGDLTQVMITNFAAAYKSPLSVFIGGSLGLVGFALVGTLAGNKIKEKVPLEKVRVIAGIIMLGLSIYSILDAFF